LDLLPIYSGYAQRTITSFNFARFDSLLLFSHIAGFLARDIYRIVGIILIFFREVPSVL